MTRIAPIETLAHWGQWHCWKQRRNNRGRTCSLSVLQMFNQPPTTLMCVVFQMSLNFPQKDAIAMSLYIDTIQNEYHRKVWRSSSRHFSFHQITLVQLPFCSHSFTNYKPSHQMPLSRRHLKVAYRQDGLIKVTSRLTPSKRVALSVEQPGTSRWAAN